jgi:hypothetical protein
VSTPRVVPGSLRVKTAWTDPEHVRLSQPEPRDRVDGRHAERLRSPDPEDPWVIGTIWGYAEAAGHSGCGGWSLDSRDDVIVCACGGEIPAAGADAA